MFEMYKSCDKEQKRTLRRGLYSLLAILLLIVTGMYAVTANTLGWFSENNNVNGTMGVMPGDAEITAEFYYKTSAMTDFEKITEWDKLFEGLIPGDAVILKAEYVSAEDKDYSADIFLTVPSGGEVALMKDGDGDGIDEYCYLGSQIKVTEVVKSDTGGTVMAGGFLVENADGLTVCFDEEKQPHDLQLARALTIPAGGTLSVEITLEFVNMPVDQNVYQDFGKGNECCYRILTARLIELTSP